MNASRPSPPRARSAARLGVVQALYQWEITQEPLSLILKDFVPRYLGRELDGDQYENADVEHFREIAEGVAERLIEIDQHLGQVCESKRGLGGMEPLMRAILRPGAYELLARLDVPARVAVNEYVNLAHAFFAGAEPGLINAMLDRLARTLRPGEFKP